MPADLPTPPAADHSTPPAGEQAAPPPLLLARIGALRAAVVTRPVALHGTAVLRIGYGLLYFAFLLREFPYRDEMWGPGSPWTPELATRLFDQTGWFSLLTVSDSPVHFELCYVFALLVSLAFAAGWRTRATSVVFALVVASFHARAIFSTDGGDNLILLLAVYLCLTASGRRWSLDARRAARRAAAGAPAPAGRSALRAELGLARRQLVVLLHNCGLLVIAAQVCFVYGAAGLYKVQGGMWGSGTAMHYVLNLELFRPWPALSELLAGHLPLLALLAYLTVLLQVAFPFVLFGRAKYPVLVAMFGMHLGIAVLLGLPFFSAAMIIADAVFLPDRFYLAVAARLRTLLRRPAPHAAHPASVPPPPRAPAPPASAPVPPLPGAREPLAPKAGTPPRPPAEAPHG